MKKNIAIILFGILLVISFFSIKVSTNIYVGDYSYSSRSIDIQLKIDDKLILDDSLYSSPFFPTILNEKLRYGVHKVNVSSKKAGIDQESRVLIFPNQHIFLEFLGADTLDLGKEDLVRYGSIEVSPGMDIFNKRIPCRIWSEFVIESRFNPFYTE
ncbi:hypothetical protein [Bacteroides salyersiae]|uniref:hypothetical protein n=1 Tax=Bacteroides salyersiae TaxID=291644 RepID=UPI001C8C63B0|nr:hypothetical protein [Bacteroides salyersiae]